MPVYFDKETGRLFIKFGFKGATYKKRLPPDVNKTTARQLETKWKNDLLFASFGIDKDKNILYENFLTAHFLPYAEKHYSAEGYKNVIAILKASLKFMQGLSIRGITPAEIEKFKNHRAGLKTKHGRKRKPSTVARELNIISKVFSRAVKANFIDYNPCSRVDRPVYDSGQDKILPFDKIGEFLDNFKADWARDVAELILNTGLRQNDALGLKKEHADFGKKLIRLTQGKTRRRVIIPMNGRVFELLKARADNGSDLFFPSPRTGRRGVSIKKALQLAADRTNLGRVGTRVLRRTFATMLAERNFNSGVVAKLLGHANLRSVHRYERETEILRDAVDALSY